jgi:hypothetical protein
LFAQLSAIAAGHDDVCKKKIDTTMFFLQDRKRGRCVRHGAHSIAERAQYFPDVSTKIGIILHYERI